jgi:lipopolysaccharide/colanic/teichoic acid biosynthesis glycosyltransferase
VSRGATGTGWTLTQQITAVTDGRIQPRTAGRSAALADEVTGRLVQEIEARGWQARDTSAFAVKRAVDVIVSASLSVIVVPVVLLLAIVGAIHFRANPFFTQTRLGQDGEEFTILKLRSLPPETGAYLLKETLGQQELSWFSKLLRGSKLDELPQLLHVLTGKMTLVGPRPKMPDRFEPVGFAYAHARTRVPQGCTCLWQVGVTTEGLPSDSPEFDYFYLLHGGPKLDLWIVMRTALTLFGLAEPVSLDDIPGWARGDGWIEPAVTDDDDEATLAA